MTKIFIFPLWEVDHWTVYAVGNDGEPIAGHPVDELVQLESAVASVNDYCADRYPNASRVYVDTPQQHPFLANLLTQTAADQAAAATQSDETAVSLCTSCLHSAVCIVASATGAIGARISACPEHREEEQP